MSTRHARLLGLLLLASCSKKAPPSQHDSDAGTQIRGALVARVGQVELREDDVQRAMARDPGASAARFQRPGARRELIDGLVRFELLVQAADRAGFTKDPDAIHALQQIAVTKLVNHTLGAAGSPETITQADVEREYAARQASDYTLPEAVRVRHLRVSNAQLAAQLASKAKSLAPSDDHGFASLASANSEDSATRATGGDLGFIDKNSALPRRLVDAALTLKTAGDSVGPIAVDSNYEILRLVSVRGAIVSPLSSVEQPIRQRLYRERRTKALDELIAKLRRETPVELAQP